MATSDAGWFCWFRGVVIFRRPGVGRQSSEGEKWKGWSPDLGDAAAGGRRGREERVRQRKGRGTRFTPDLVGGGVGLHALKKAGEEGPVWCSFATSYRNNRGNDGGLHAIMEVARVVCVD
ncbi:hypothetical protein HAX54_030457 [Datura stramonium]|uniref:Uncharacterized protein n=1 Tax=Datura stramonium TaxID=4076 RepID=A0ABS8VA00_DATST|nr:hypothetical protein [Datura stramonium]